MKLSEGSKPAELSPPPTPQSHLPVSPQPQPMPLQPAPLSSDTIKGPSPLPLKGSGTVDPKSPSLSTKAGLLERLWDAVEKQDANEARKVLVKLTRGSRLGSKSNPLVPAVHRRKLTSYLHVAALSGLLDIVQLLLTHEAPIDTRDHAGFTPLLSAASQRHWECVGLLLDHGANPTLVSTQSISLLHLLAVPGEPGDLPVQLQLMSRCLNSGGQVNAKDYNGDTALMVAASKNQTDIGAFLLENGAKVRGWPPPHRVPR